MVHSCTPVSIVINYLFITVLTWRLSGTCAALQKGTYPGTVVSSGNHNLVSIPVREINQYYYYNDEPAR